MRNWYYHDAGEQKGPIAETELVKLFQSGQLTGSTLVWTEGLEAWQEASTIENLVPVRAAPRLMQAPRPTAPAAAPAAPVEAQHLHPEGACPLCGQDKLMHKALPLYGHMVCRKCYYSFANRRQLGFFIDAMIWRMVLFPVGFVIGIGMATSGASADEIQATGTALDLLLFPVFLCKDCFGGQSLGKLICGVQAINEETGQPAGLGASFKRNLPLMIPFMPLIVAFSLGKGSRIGDGWAHTKVIWKKYAANPVFAVEGT